MAYTDARAVNDCTGGASYTPGSDRDSYNHAYTAD
jgi:hypothetical protein